MEIREGDVFRFRYNKEEAAKQFEPYHCFDGQLIAFRKRDGSIYLADTYWMTDFSKPDIDSKTFTPEKAQEKGELEFKCNLNEVVFIKPAQVQYYGYSDVINLTHHNGHKKAFAILKGTERDIDAALHSLERKLDQKKDQRKSLDREIEELCEKIGEAKQGKFPVAI